MKPPNEIAADAVRDELYARAAFAALISRPAREFRTAVESNPRTHTEFMARHIVDYYDDRHETIRPEHGLELLTAARLAARHGEPHLRCLIEKAIANVLRFLGRFRDAAEALQLAEGYARQTSARDAHDALVEFGRVALCFDTDRFDEAVAHARNAISDFEAAGAHDRAYSVSLYVACIQGRIGQHVQALATFLDAARYARERGTAEELGRAYYNVGHCYRSLRDFDLARCFFARSAQVFRRANILAAAGRSLRCVARMEIALHGEAAVAEMETAKSIFLELSLAGEVCRSTLAIMQELLRRDPEADLTSYGKFVRLEALSYGILSVTRTALQNLADALRTGNVDEDLLQQTWDAFAPDCKSGPSISAFEIVEN